MIKTAARFVQTERNFTQEVELPGHRATAEQLSMMLTRYEFASRYCKSRRVLEVACGGGTGLGLLAKVAQSVVGGDITPENLAIARQTYQGRENIQLVEMDALAMPFEDHSFDVLLLLDSLYFLSDFPLFLKEAKRVLKSEGVLILTTVNPQWKDFNPSRKASRYYSASDLLELLQRQHWGVEVWGAFEDSEDGWKSAVISPLRRIASNLRIIPRSVRAKELLKRIFYGKLEKFSPEIDEGSAPTGKVIPLTSADLSSNRHKLLYFVVQRASGA